MLVLVCPCGHFAPLPEDSGRYVCSKCKHTTELIWISGQYDPGSWHPWRWKSGRIAARPASAPRVEWRAAGV